MPFFDLPADELRAFRPEVAEPVDFDAFWTETLAASRAFATPPRVARVDSPLSVVDVHDVEFSGFAGDPVKGWLLTPAGAEGPLPAIVEYVGYGGGRGLPHERLQWAASGYAHLVMDTRGQGSAWGTGGGTPDPHGTGPSFPGFMTRGIHDPAEYYYRRVFTDAVLAVDAMRSLDVVDAGRVAVTGGSQGGGIALAAAGLVEGLVGAMPDVPFLCCFERSVGLTDRDPYHEIVRYLAVHRDAAPTVFSTLSYFDGVNFAKRASAPALVSVALMDPVCAPSTVYAAANHHAVGAEVAEYAFNEHEGGQGVHWSRQASWLADRLRGGPLAS
ncbi:acetylxylan esterase [Agromyces sp. SYSU T0242]|uniref:acetylxylan esterase n=1 Tax=Agromyces litoreus TaxID=3158561 RepID=UPI003398C71B